MIEIYLQILINSLIIGSLYALIACGLSLIYNVNKFMHLAHGITISVSAYLMFWLITSFKVNFYLGIILTTLFSGFFGVATYQFLYKPLIKRKTNNVVLLVASLSILLLFENFILIIFGADIKTYNFTSEVYHFFGISLTNIQALIIISSSIIFTGLWFFLKKTTFGKSIRAVSDNKELSQVMGVNVDKIILTSFFIASIIAGFAGILIGLEQNLTPTMGMAFTIKGFVGAIVGGLTNIAGSIGGGYIIGLFENFGVWFLPSQFKEAITFVLLFLILLFKPTGLFGIKEREN